MISSRKKYGRYFATIGLEIHVALQTKQKLFSVAANEFESKSFALLDCGLPGVMPVLDKQAVQMAIAFGLACKAKVEPFSIFERKHYFYPDLPLGYQITQQHQPILMGGEVEIQTAEGKKIVKIEHAHLECDAAKSIHDLYSQYTAIDLSRCGSALLEIVSTPCMHTPQEAKAYAKEVHSLVTFMKICDGKMQEGSFRVDASISLSETEDTLGTRVEIKNISSFAFLEAALEHEIIRQSELLQSGQKVLMQTRLFDEKTMTTKSMRDKETAQDYRYVPDPDIAPLVVSEQMIEQSRLDFKVDFFEIKQKMLQLFCQYKIEITQEQIIDLLQQSHQSLWLELLQSLESIDKPIHEKLIRLLAFWLPEVLQKTIAVKEIQLSDLIFIAKSSLQAKEAKDVMSKWLSEKSISLESAMPKFMSVEEVREIIIQEMMKWPEQVEQARQGNEKIVQFLTGKCMAQLKGKAPAAQVKEIVMEQLRK